MIVEFSITNFRSIKERQTFSLVAETTKSKRESNTFEVDLQAGTSLRLLRSAVMYGGNASGKSNFIRAFAQLRALIVTSGYAAIGQPILFYSPFLFDVASREAPTSFECSFIFDGQIKYDYSVSFDRQQIQQEELNYYPKQIKKNLFKRVVEAGQEFDSVRFNKDIVKEETALSTQMKIFKNQAVLSRFGREIPHAQLTPLFLYFANWRIWEANNSEDIRLLTGNIINDVIPRKDSSFFLKLQRLIQAADTKVGGLVLKETQEPTPSIPNRRSAAAAANRLFGVHAVFNKQIEESSHELPFAEESAGTKVLFALGALILDAIENGGTVLFDELDNSLHPRISRFLVRIFNNQEFNLKNAQIVFTSHEANLMDKDIFRSDQIWFAEKDEKGATEIYSAQDFDGVREDISFEKWYLSGKFGAIPQTSEIAYIFSDAKETTRPS